jgi:hypothetical protein
MIGRQLYIRQTTMSTRTMTRPANAIEQPFPTDGFLARRLSVGDLVHELSAERGTVYTYVVATVKCSGGRYVQTGSAPNFQCGLITLCNAYPLRTRNRSSLLVGDPEKSFLWSEPTIAWDLHALASPQGLGRRVKILQLQSFLDQLVAA